MNTHGLILRNPQPETSELTESLGSLVRWMCRANVTKPQCIMGTLVSDEALDEWNSPSGSLLLADALIKEGVSPDVMVLAVSGWNRLVSWCPDCRLGNARRHFLRWQTQTYCVTHGCRLVTACPACGWETTDLLLWLSSVGCVRCGA